eukprot:TRINITY_DN12201_c0_g2_i1.p1 TRINITY_DN12201_c0_g2~~TRINITY_DN12201_c0_g2_i1.p1  ORF type:complete len:417 (+),score=108.74 TRINITY_DN12201_c0_g2_i1:139-1389(+)
MVEKLVAHYKKSRINLVILQSNKITDKMVKIIMEYYNSKKNKLFVIEMKEKDLMQKDFAKNFVQSMTNSFAVSRWRNFKKIKRKHKQPEFAIIEDDLDFGKKFKGEVHSVAIKGVNYEKRIFEYRLETLMNNVCNCEIAGTKVGVGMFSNCFQLKVDEDSEYVAKISKNHVTEIEELKDDIELSAFVELFVQKFNFFLEEKNLIKKLPLVIIKIADGEKQKINGSTVFLAQKYMEGEYLKYNNNFGWVNSDKSIANKIAQAFSHFTYEYSLGTILVTDIQGVYKNDSLIITDPAIHSLFYRDHFGYTNHSQIGILRFFQTHFCNEYCKKLKLLDFDSIKDKRRVEEAKAKYGKVPELMHLYEKLQEEMKETQRDIMNFDPTVVPKTESEERSADSDSETVITRSNSPEHTDRLSGA